MRYTLQQIKDGTGFRPGAQFEEVTDYNGWPNRETWAVALHINNDQGWQDSVHDALRTLLDEGDYDPLGRNEYAAGNIIRENVEQIVTPDGVREAFGEPISEAQARILEDIGSLWRVDWTELGRVFLSDLDES